MRTTRCRGAGVIRSLPSFLLVLVALETPPRLSPFREDDEDSLPRGEFPSHLLLDESFCSIDAPFFFSWGRESVRIARTDLLKAMGSGASSSELSPSAMVSACAARDFVSVLDCIMLGCSEL